MSDSEKPAPPAKKSKKKLMMIIGVVAVAAIGYLVVLPKLSKPAAAATGAAGKPKPAASAKPGAVLKEEPITLNLADGHYLRLGIALQLPTGVGESDVDGSMALNTAIEILSGKSESSLTGSKRVAAIANLDKAIIAAYGPTVVTQVYLTDFVMQ